MFMFWNQLMPCTTQSANLISLRGNNNCEEMSRYRALVMAQFAPSTHYNDVIMGAIASEITSFTIVYSNVDQRKHQSSASLAFVRGIQRGPENSPHRWPVTRKLFPLDNVIMNNPDSTRGWNMLAWPKLEINHEIHPSVVTYRQSRTRIDALL